MAQLYLIGDEVTTTGFGLAGIKAYKSTPEEVGRVLDELKDKADIIVVTNRLYEHALDKIKKLQAAGKIIIKIPDKSGGGEDVVSKLIKDTIGFEIKSTKKPKEGG